MESSCDVKNCENKSENEYWVSHKIKKNVCKECLKKVWKKDQTNFKKIPWINDESIANAELLKSDDDITWD